jgi:hypothetical protein
MRERVERLQRRDVNVTCRSSQDLIYQHKTAKDLPRNLLYVIHLVYLPGLTRRTQNPPTFGSWGFDSPSRHHRLQRSYFHFMGTTKCTCRGACVRKVCAKLLGQEGALHWLVASSLFSTCNSENLKGRFSGFGNKATTQC